MGTKRDNRRDYFRLLEGIMDELKACPFCGNDAVMETFTTMLEKVPRFRVRCSNCTADIGWDFFKVEDAKAAWNQRKININQ